MVDVSEKAQTLRTATAKATVYLNGETYNMVVEGKMKKGDVLAVAQVGGIMAAKRTFESIPMCHPISLTGADISFELDSEKHTIDIYATTKCKGETGVEMEALNAAATAALTVYDMCKAVQRDIEIGNIMLLKKTGGKSGEFIREEK
jgi:cyclic pyranopterin phosphate synthase